MRVVLDAPQPIETLRKVYNDKVTFVTTVSKYPLIDALEFNGDYLGAMKKRAVPVRVGKQVDKLIAKYEKRLRAIWKKHQRAILKAVKAPTTEVDKADAPTLAQVLAESDPSRQAVLRQRYLKARRDELIKPEIDEMKENLKRAAVATFTAAYILGKQRGQILTNQEMDDELGKQDRAILDDRLEWNDGYIDKLSDEAYENYQETLEETYESDEDFLAAFAKAQEKEEHRLSLFAATAGSILLAAGMTQAMKDVQAVDPETGEPTGEPLLDEETGLPLGDVQEGGIWHTSHDERVCEGCEDNDGFWMPLDDFEEEQGTNDCLTRCRCVELFEPAERPTNDAEIWGGEPGIDKFAKTANAKVLPSAKVIAVDLDGTIAENTPGADPGRPIGKPIPGAKEVLQRFKDDGHEIIIFSSRGDEGTIADYLKQHKIPYDHINYNPHQPEGANIGKPVAGVYVDNNALHFDGDWLAMEQQMKDHLNRPVKKGGAGSGSWEAPGQPRFAHEGKGIQGTIKAFSNKVDTATPAKAFDKCYETAQAFASHAKSQGHDVKLVQLAESPKFEKPETRWEKIPSEFRTHYVAVVDGKYVDWAAKQFDPTAPVPTIYSSLKETGWGREYNITDQIGKGGPGSGHFGHAGIPGQVGGSQAGEGGGAEGVGRGGYETTITETGGQRWLAEERWGKDFKDAVEKEISNATEHLKVLPKIDVATIRNALGTSATAKLAKEIENKERSNQAYKDELKRLEDKKAQGGDPLYGTSLDSSILNARTNLERSGLELAIAKSDTLKKTIEDRVQKVADAVGKQSTLADQNTLLENLKDEAARGFGRGGRNAPIQSAILTSVMYDALSERQRALANDNDQSIEGYQYTHRQEVQAQWDKQSDEDMKRARNAVEGGAQTATVQSRRNYQNGRDWVKGNVSPWLLQRIPAVEWQAKRGNRSFYHPQDGTIKLATDDRPGTIPHEFMHHLEKNIPEISDFFSQYYNARTQGESPVKLSRVNPGRSYESYEYTRLDKFTTAYMGHTNIQRGMESRSGGEIFSTAVGMFATRRDAAELYRRDPELFGITASILKGWVPMHRTDWVGASK